MTLKDILAKIAKGEQFTDDDKQFAGSFDLQTQLDAAAGAARKKAEAETKAAKDALAKLQGEFEDFKLANDPAKGQGEIQKLTTRIERIEAARKAAEDKAAALERTATIRELQKKHGVIAAKGIAPKTFDMLVDNLLADVDITDDGAVTSAFDSFKADNAGLIASNTIGGVGVRGLPGASALSGVNPFSKKTFNLTEQVKLSATQPELAASLKQAAAQEGN